MTDYKPIDCHFHDDLEDASVLKKIVEFVLPDNQKYRGLLLDFKTQNGEEFVLLEGNIWLRLDKIKNIKIF